MRKDVPALKFGSFTFTPATHVVRSRSGTSMRLQPEQCAILNDLAIVKDEVVTKEALYRGICERRNYPPEPRIVDVQVCKLRRILDYLSPNGGNHIVTVWGKGYFLSEKPQARKKALQGVRGPRDKGLLKRLAEEYLNAP